MRSTRNTGHSLQDYCERFQSLRTDQCEGRPRPHKAVMLLAVLSLADNGQLLENRIVYGPELLLLFKRFFGVVRGPSDQCSAWLPFYHLQSDQFWHLHAQPGAVPMVGGPRSGAAVRAGVAHAFLDEDLFVMVSQPAARESLRQALIDRYFSAQRTALLTLCGEEREIGRVREAWRDADYRADTTGTNGTPEPVRSAAFSRTVTKAYDYRCAACGIRFLYNEITVIDAAHLVPFCESRDDSPQNGMALCKNHHWLMDALLIAPGPGRRQDYARPIWYVRRELDVRIEGQRELLKFRNQPVILPADARLAPKREALDRRLALLREAC